MFGLWASSWVLSSFASEVAVRLLASRSRAGHGDALQGGPGHAVSKFGWWVLKDGFDGVRHKLFKLRAKPRQRQKPNNLSRLKQSPSNAAASIFASKICDSLN
jgi:hypothetical protein